ncbi:MAG: HIT domain-containing protein [Nanoarchaeota archaeon]
MAEQNCFVCEIVKGTVPSEKIYEDDEILAFLDVNGASPGHCFVIPKEHYPIFEQVPDSIVQKLFVISNKISVAIFESLAAPGTNIFITNGIAADQKVAHFMINIVPRSENDGINLQWQPRQLNEEEMSTIELKLKEESAHIGGFQDSKPIEKIRHNTIEPITGEDNYLLKSLRRIP